MIPQFQKLVLLFFVTIFSFYGFTQSDSLKSVLEFQKQDSNRVNTLNKLSDAYSSEGKFTDAVQAGIAALSLAKKTKFKKGEATANHKLAIAYIGQKKDSTANQYILQAITLNQEVGNKKAVAEFYYEISYRYMIMTNLPDCLKYLYKSLKVFEGLKDTSSVAFVLSAIGITHLSINNYSIALDNLLASLKLFKKMGNQGEIAGIYQTLAQLYRKTGKYHQSLKADSSALKIFKQQEDRFSSAWILSSIGRTIEMQGLIENRSANTIYREALGHYNDALAMFRKTGQTPDSYPVVKMHVLIGNAYIKLQNYSEARNYLNKSLQFATQTNHLENLSESHRYLALLDSIEGNYKQAYFHFRNHLLYQDSIVNSEGLKQSLIYKMQYDSDKNELIAKAFQEKKDSEAKRARNLQLFGMAFLLLLATFFFISKRQNQKAKAKIERAYTHLKSTQQQLIQSEKMASLGELTAGIAHEIQNPLNFVNNFSEVNKELLAEMNEEIDKGNFDEVKGIANDIADNEEKINHHGKRADAIVKGMLQHSRSSSGQKELTDINALTDEYLRLAYHGLRAKDNSFNATLKTDYDESIGNINIIPQDIGRVFLNLINNAFYAVSEKKKQQPDGYEPVVAITTTKTLKSPLGGFGVSISVKDNGNGIPKKVLDKIFQPFFTTKPTGQGTGLGLSLSYDIIKAHGGELKVETKEGEFAKFIIQLPLN